MPDMITCAKGLTNGAVPMGAVFVRKHIYDAFMESPAEDAIELFHGYTYSGHPVACAAAPRHARHLSGGRPVRAAPTLWPATGKTRCTR